MHLTFKEYVLIEEALQICRQLDESSLEEGLSDFNLKKLIDGYKAALKARADAKQAEIAAKLKAEWEKRRALNKQKEGFKEPGTITVQDIEDALSPEDRKALAKMDRSRGTSGTSGTSGTQGTTGTA